MTNDEFIEKESDTNELVGVVLQELDSSFRQISYPQGTIGMYAR